jgi:hypothetical protein
MEVFARPYGRKDETKIPYMGSDSFDGGAFSFFPERCGFADSVAALGQSEALVSEEPVIRRFHGFLQDCLFWAC